MNERKRTSTKSRKRAARGIALCFIAAVALTGAYTWTNYKERAVNELETAKKEQEVFEIQKSEAASGTAQKASEESLKNSGTDASVGGSAASQEEENHAADNPNAGLSTPSSSEKVTSTSFTEKDKLLWPVDGNVLMSYSMDKTIYFATLDQYKCNPALIISAAENDNVIAAAPGVVKSIDVLPQTGTTVTIDMGNGYECLYGQLEDVQVKTGENVDAGRVLGFLGEPTKYYSVEGCNLYFEMRKDGQPVNPIDYVDQD